MAKKNDRQGYVLYKSWNSVLLSMTDAELGQVFRSIIMYQEGYTITNAPPFFEVIKYSFIQDEQRYNQKCNDNRLNRLIGNLKGLKDDVLRAQLDMIDLQDLQAIVEKVKDPDLKNTLILELHERTKVTNVTHVTSDTNVTNKSKNTESNTESDSNIDSESNTGSNTESDLNTDSGLGEGMEIEKGVQGEKEEPHLHGDYQNITLTDSEWYGLIEQFGMDAVEAAIQTLSHKAKKTGRIETFMDLQEHLKKQSLI